MIVRANGRSMRHTMEHASGPSSRPALFLAVLAAACAPRPKSSEPVAPALARGGPATERVSVGSSAQGGAQGLSGSFAPSISADGRYVAFQSYAGNLVAGDGNPFQDVFVRDRRTGVTEIVSRSTTGTAGNGDSISPSISGDGRYVAFASAATNLLPPGQDTNSSWDVFVRDRLTGITARASVDEAGGNSDGHSTSPSISADGRFVAFESNATDLVPGDGNGTDDVFLRDLLESTTARISAIGAVEGNGRSLHPAISADGLSLAFYSYASNLVAGDANGVQDVFLYDASTGSLERASVGAGGAEADGTNLWPAISSGNPFVAWPSAATNLVPNDTNAFTDVFVRGPY